jgi:hypothetical protein
VISRRDECLLDGVIGSVEIARAPRQRAEDLRRQGAKQVLDRGREVQ